MVIKEVKSEVGRAKKIFFTLLVHRIDTLQILVVRTQNPLVQRKKTAAKTDWLWLTKMSRRKQVDDEPSIPKNGCYSCHKQRDAFGKLHKTCNF